VDAPHPVEQPDPADGPPLGEALAGGYLQGQQHTRDRRRDGGGTEQP
jgi:hypothetical protein